MAPQLGWIGLGNMGIGMSMNLHEHVRKTTPEKPLLVFNRTASKAEHLKASGATILTSVDELRSKSDIIFTCVSNDAAINDIFEQFFAGDVKGKVFCEMSTVHPETTSALYDKATAAGAEFVSAPVFGAPPVAASGQLLIILAGNPKAIEKVKLYCTGVMGRATLDLGEDAARGSLMKVIGNTFVLAIVESLAEAHVLAEKSGLGTDTLDKFLNSMFPGSAFVGYSQRMISGNYVPDEGKGPLFGADLAQKDAKHALDLAKKAGAKMSVTEIAEKHLQTAQHSAPKRNVDLAAIYGAVRMEAGLNFSDKIQQ
ncbi:hypothetical protein YB2330_004604 [Saitoella coloradoensis]